MLKDDDLHNDGKAKGDEEVIRGGAELARSFCWSMEGAILRIDTRRTETRIGALNINQA